MAASGQHAQLTVALPGHNLQTLTLSGGFPVLLTLLKCGRGHFTRTHLGMYMLSPLIHAHIGGDTYAKVHAHMHTHTHTHTRISMKRWCILSICVIHANFLYTTTWPQLRVAGP